MEVQVEPIVVHPYRAAEVAGDRKPPLSESRREMDPCLDHPLHMVIRERTVLARSEDRQAGDMHVQRRCFQIQEARIQAGETFRRHRPMLGSAPMWRRPLLHGMLAVTAALIWFSPGSIAGAHDDHVVSTAALLRAGVGPGREPVPTGYAGTVRVPQDFDTIQAAVDHAQPGGMVLIAPGIYEESVTVTTPYLTIRGVDRDRTIIDGGSQRADGV